MIHTMTIQKEITWSPARRILESMGRDDVEIRAFLTGRENPIRGKIESTIRIPSPWTGIHEISVSRSVRPTSDGTPYTTYFCYVRMELLTVITHETHIDLFECSDDNIRKLQDEFRAFMVAYLQLDGKQSFMNEIAELSTWDANRVDFTRDIRMNNHDEVLAMMNLCKMSVLSTRRKGALEPTSIYDTHFNDDMFKFGNNSWEVEIYDKQKEIENNKQKYITLYDSKDIYERLHKESEYILRFEYRRKYKGIGKNSTKLESKNIMQFLSEELAERWFHSFYGEDIGYEPFYVLDYQLDLKLAEGFPMSKLERQQEYSRKLKYDKAADLAKNEGRELVPYKKKLLGKKAQKHRDHMSFISTHNGMQNALNAYDGSTSTFKVINKRIRECAGVSPVPIPKNWIIKREDGTGRGMELPHDFLPNPIQRPKE